MLERTQETRDRILAEDAAQRAGQAAYAGNLTGWVIEPTAVESSVLSKFSARFTYSDRPDWVSVLKRGS